MTEAKVWEPEGVPEGAEALGVAALFEAYDATAAARCSDPTVANIRAFQKAQQALHDARVEWSEIGAAVRQAAYDAWAEANPEAALQNAVGSEPHPDTPGASLGTPDGKRGE